jgi:hypothetical protein
MEGFISHIEEAILNLFKTDVELFDWSMVSGSDGNLVLFAQNSLINHEEVWKLIRDPTPFLREKFLLLVS